MDLKNKKLKETSSIEEVKDVKVESKMINSLFDIEFNPSRDYKINKESNWNAIQRKYKESKEFRTKTIEIEEIKLHNFKRREIVEIESNFEYMTNQIGVTQECMDFFIDGMKREIFELKEPIEELKKKHMYQDTIEVFQDLKIKFDTMYEINEYGKQKMYDLYDKINYEDKEKIIYEDCIDFSEIIEGLKVNQSILDKIEIQMQEHLECYNILDKYIDIYKLIEDISDCTEDVIFSLLNILDFDIFVEETNDDKQKTVICPAHKVVTGMLVQRRCI